MTWVAKLNFYGIFEIWDISYRLIFSRARSCWWLSIGNWSHTFSGHFLAGRPPATTLFTPESHLLTTRWWSLKDDSRGKTDIPKKLLAEKSQAPGSMSSKQRPWLEEVRTSQNRDGSLCPGMNTPAVPLDLKLHLSEGSPCIQRTKKTKLQRTPTRKKNFFCIQTEKSDIIL